MKKTKRIIWLLILLTGLGLAIWIAYRSVVLPLSPNIELIKRAITYAGLILMLIIVIISSIGLANSIITQENILKNYTRAKIFTLIKAKPGVHYSEIVRNLKLGKGQTTWHLAYLERYNMIRRLKTKRFVTYYPNDGMQIDENEFNIQLVLLKSETRNQIYEIICDKPAITQKEIKKDINVSQSTLAYHLIILEELDLITIQKKGRRRYYFVNDNNMIHNVNTKIKIPS